MTTDQPNKRFFLRAAVLLLAVIMTATTARADSLEDAYWQYSDAPGGTCTITGNTLPDKQKASTYDLTIPKTLGGKTVSGFSWNALSGFTRLKTIRFYQDASIENMPYMQNNTYFSTILLIDGNGETVEGGTNCLPASMIEIGNAFTGSGITSLTMPGVTSIGDRAFEGCNSLTSVTFGQAATGIGGYATPFAKISSTCMVTYPGSMSNWSVYNYQYSPKLKVSCTDGSCGWCGDGWAAGWTNENNLYKDNSCVYWTLDNSGLLTIDCLNQDIILDNYFSKQVVKTKYWTGVNVTSLRVGRVYAIDYLQHASLTTIVVDEGNPKYDSRDGCNAIIETATNTLVYGCKSSSIPSSVTSIGAYAFKETTLTSIVIPSSVTSIGAFAFSSCSALTSVVIPSSVTSIGSYAFSGCSGLTSVVIPSSVTSIGKFTFYSCPNLANLCFDGTEAQWNAVTKGDYWNSGVSSDFAVRWPCAVTASAGEASIAIPYGQEWTDITVTLNSLTMGWFWNEDAQARVADAVAVTPLVGSGASMNLTFYKDSEVTLTGRKGAGAHTNTSALSESLTAAGQSATLWVHIPEEVWAAAAAGDYSTYLNYDAVFISNDPAETYTYSLGSGAQVALSLTVPEAITLTFDANGGTGTMDAVSGRVGVGVQLPACTFTAPDGKDFLCWNTQAYGNGTRYYAGSTFMPAASQTLYAEWAEPCAVTASASEASIAIPYGQEWTDIAVTLNSLTLGWFQNGTNPARVADAVAVTPLVGNAASMDLTFYKDGEVTLTGRKGAGAHTNTGALSESLTAAGQSATLWVHIPEEVWAAAAAGDYSTYLNFDAAFVCNDPAETYAYSLGSEARVALSLTVPEAATLTFNANGGTGTMQAVSGRVGVGVQLPTCTFTAPVGKDFLCWNTQADAGGTRYYAGSTFMPAASQTLYAEWGEGYVIDLTATAVGESVVIPLGLSAQLTQLTGYFNNETDPMGLDVNLDGVKDLAIVQEYDDVNDVMTASVTKLTSLTENYRFVLPAPTEEGEYGSVLIKFVSSDSAVEPGAIELLYDDNGTYNSGQLLVLKDGHPHNLMLSGRTIHTDGKWNTLCLPFNIDDFSGTPLEGFTVKELDTETAYSGHVTGIDGETLYLNFKDASSIEAGKPYIVKKSGSADIVNPVFYNVTVTTATGEVTNPFRESYEDPEFITVAVPTDVVFTDGKFCGNYDPVRISGEDRSVLFLGAANNLHFANGETLGALRAFIKIDEAAQPTAYVIDFGNGETAKGLLGVILGDANGDGQVTITDAVAIVNYILGNPSANFNIVAANVNGDKDDEGKPKITITDAVAVVNIILNSGGSSAP